MSRASTDQQKKPRAKGDPFMLGLLTLAVAPAFGLGMGFGAGSVAIIGGLVALFAVIAFLGGSLRADARVIAIVTPCLFVASVGPRLLSEVSQAAAIAATVAIVFVGALLPLISPRLVNVGQGVGMATLFSYGSAVAGPYSATQLCLAVLAGLIVAIALRVLFGARDPRRATRGAVASVLDAERPDVAGAFEKWLDDARPTWLGRALDAAVRYRAALGEVRWSGRVRPDEGAADAATVLTARASDLARRLRSRSALAASAELPSLSDELAAVAAVSSASAHLDAVEDAMVDRDTTPAPLTAEQRSMIRVLRRPASRARKAQVRHAIRTAVGILAILVVAAQLRSGDPLVASVLLATYAILQASWKESLTRAVPRFIGVGVGAVLALAIILFAPQSALLPVSLVALVVGLWYITGRPSIGYGCMVLVSVGLNASTRNLDPSATLAEYTVLMLAGLSIGLFFGFLVVPGGQAPSAARPRPGGLDRDGGGGVRAHGSGGWGRRPRGPRGDRRPGGPVGRLRAPGRAGHAPRPELRRGSHRSGHPGHAPADRPRRARRAEAPPH